MRERIVDLAESYAGTSALTDREKYLDLVAGPIEAPGRANYFLSPRTSGCALVVRGLWRKSGLCHPLLSQPYRIGYAVSDVVEIAKLHGAWIPNYKMGDRRPLPGDAVLIGGPGQEHFFTITEVLAEDRFASIDGGQTGPDGNQSIQSRSRQWKKVGTNVLDICDGLYGPRSKPVQGFVDVSKLPFPDDFNPKGCALPG